MTAIMTATTKPRSDKPLHERQIDIMEGHIEVNPNMVTARVTSGITCEYLKSGEIVVIDRSRTRLWESGIFCFEHDGDILIRQFQTTHQIDRPGYVLAVGSWPHNQEYAIEKMNIIGEVVAKHVPIKGGIAL